MAQEILISINVESGEAKARVNDLKKGTDDLSKSFGVLAKQSNKNKFEQASLRGEQKLAAAQQKKLNYEMQNAGKIAAVYEMSTKGAGSATKQFRTQSGLNNAILMETGRLASDASYGFTAIANNLSQLVSLGGSFVQTTGSITTAFGELKKSLMGIGGVLLAVQILIGLLQSKEFINFIKTLGGISAAMRALKKALSEATDVYGAQIGKLETLARLLEDDNVTQEQRAMILKEVKKDNEDLNLQLDEQNKLTADSVKQINARIAVLKVQAETSALISAIEEERVKQLKLENADADEILGWWETTTALITNFGNTQAAAIEAIASADEQRAEGIGDSQEIIDKLYEKLALIVNFDTDDKKNGSKRSKVFREFEEGLFNIQNIVDKYNKEADRINVRTLDEKLDLEEEYAKREADTKLSNFKEQQAKRLEEYKERVKGAKNAGKLIANAELDYQNSIEDAKIKHGEAILSIEDGIITKRILAKDKEAQAIAKIERSIENTEIDRLKFSIGANEEYFDKKIEQVGKDKDNVDAQIANADALKLSDLEVADLRKQSFELQNQQIDLNLNKEISSIKAKQTINMEYVGFAKGISQLMGTLAGENEAMQKAALIVEKGAAIADIVIKTQSANAVTIAQDTASLGATIPVTTPLRLRNNISAGISIANILATTIASFRKPSASGGGASSAPVQAPDFNVVGTSSVDQLAQTVAGQTNEPIKAYVVGKDVTNQQEFDRNLINTAGI
ncbi:MAG TPA: hypothetical protein DCX01_04180 [Bacteroidetes bacterium]|nr:hypothetical protein [Bacteroidota bacterium]